MRVYASEGTPFELKSLAQWIRGIQEGASKTVVLSHDISASPYETLLENFILLCCGSKIKASIRKGSLVLEFPESSGEMVASYFEFDDNAQIGAHWHFDKYCGEIYFDPECIDMVIELSDK